MQFKKKEASCQMMNTVQNYLHKHFFLLKNYVSLGLYICKYM